MTAKAGSSDAMRALLRSWKELFGPQIVVGTQPWAPFKSVRCPPPLTAAKRKGSEVGSVMRHRRGLAVRLDEEKQLSGAGVRMCLHGVRRRRVGSQGVQRPALTPRKRP